MEGERQMVEKGQDFNSRLHTLIGEGIEVFTDNSEMYLIGKLRAVYDGYIVVEQENGKVTYINTNKIVYFIANK